MKIQYLGTGAAEGTPGMFCQCATCKKSWELGGRNIRTRSQSIVDDKILIDLPEDTYLHMLAYNIDLAKIKTCIITHDHGDHLYPRTMTMRRIGFVKLDKEEPLCLYGTTPTCNMLNKIYNEKMACNKENENRVRINKIKAFEPFETEGYTIIPLKANHNPECEPVNYIIRKDNKSLLYGHDTGLFLDETWECLKKSGIKFNLVSLDCTYSIWNKYEGYHMTLNENKMIKDKMKKLKLADDNTIFVANHFSHNGGAIYDKIKLEADKIGFVTAYDGMTIEF